MILSYSRWVTPNDRLWAAIAVPVLTRRTTAAFAPARHAARVDIGRCSNTPNLG
jgi:hypothetical protein